MMKILITGKKSYIGSSFKKYIQKKSNDFTIDMITLRDDAWKDISFSKYDVVLHVSGIAHIKETKENAEMYYKVNRDLAYEVAEKAKKEGVNHFIFLSSMSVYGVEKGIITHDTPLKPKSNYGKSKLQAEKLLESLKSPSFKLAIVRPPMIYGKGCKGNYSKLRFVALKIPFFPDIKNIRSMIYIDNLCEFLILIIKDSKEGLFFPQNNDYVCTSDMVRAIARVNKKSIVFIKTFNWIFANLNTDTVNKVFGNLVYDHTLDEYRGKYTICDFKSSIRITEKQN